MICYIAGPMRNKPRFNFDAFETAEKKLEREGWTVISPHRMDLDRGWDPSAHDPFNLENFDLEGCIRRDIEAIMRCDAIMMLPGWERSKGATAEKAVAEWLGKEVYFL